VKLDRTPRALDVELREVKLALQVSVIRFETLVTRFRGHALLLPEQRHAQLIGDRFRDLLLQREDAPQLAIVGLGPTLTPISGLHERNADAHAIPCFPHAPFQQMRHPESAADCARILRPAFKPERRSAPDDAQLADLRERVDQLLGESIGEILLRGISASVHERQHRDRLRSVGNSAALLRPKHLEDEQAGRERGNKREQRSQLAAHAASFWQFRTRFAAPDDSFRRNVECPRENHRHRKAER
jgi:hypothetical protein